MSPIKFLKEQYRAWKLRRFQANINKAFTSEEKYQLHYFLEVRRMHRDKFTVDEVIDMISRKKFDLVRTTMYTHRLPIGNWRETA